MAMPLDALSKFVLGPPRPTPAEGFSSTSDPRSTLETTPTQAQPKNLCRSTGLEESHVMASAQSIRDEATVNGNPSPPKSCGDEYSPLTGTLTTAAKSFESTPPEEAAASTSGGTLALIQQDLVAGRFNIPDFNGQHIDLESPPSGTYRFPPASSPFYASPHRQRFSRTRLLPDSSLPFNIQIMEHVKDWAQFASTIQDESKRREVLDHVFEILQKVWFEALRIGYDPETIPGNGTRSHTRGVSQSKRLANPGHPPMMRARPRKGLDPMKVPVFVSRAYKESELWAVTAGELKEAGVSEDRVRQRAAGDLDDGDAILQEVLHDCEGVISKEDWHAVMDRTDSNPTGRSLFLYALFEVQWSRHNLEKLQKLYEKFATRQQKDNTQKRIDAEKERHDLFMALALEVNERTGLSRSPSPIPDQDTPSELIEVCQISDPDATDSMGFGPEDVEIDRTDFATVLGVESNGNEAMVNLHTAAAPAPEAANSKGLKRSSSPEVAEEDRQLPPSKKLRSLPSYPDATRAVPSADKDPVPIRQPVVPPIGGVAQEDQDSNRSKSKCIVALHVPGGFNPADFSSEKVFFYKGFGYRYARQSTLAQRRSMDEALHKYVHSWIKPQKGLDATWRFGKYEALCDPNDGERTTVIHGFWDEKDGSKVKGADWFYDGDGMATKRGRGN
ncbi:hypothetical protein EDD37DRAFT_482208 [Exophiala viscosa]|uniref:uncharacterized protein n=1 Tax=Exophiala viscosa TaxID=2486360 RepID=UPI002192208B|nr:hypothetical protein EDD37DRAFT_482208 [Exophiala viscosa]